MNNGAFQWDDGKAVANFARHGVSFEAACLVFKDPFALDWLDESEAYDEDRFAIIGLAQGRLLYIAYTLRGETIRIISARLAEPFERRKYIDGNET